MQTRLDKVLDRVKVLEDSLPLSHTEMVSKFRYDDYLNRLTVFTDFSTLISKCPSCLLISIDTKEKVVYSLRKELEKEFPGTDIVFA